MSMAQPLEAQPSGAERNPYLVGNYAPVREELTLADLSVEGEIPKALSGRLLRIGPNPVLDPDPAAYHWFTGSGMVHGLRLEEGRVCWYRNRYVVSDGVADALGRSRVPGPRNGFGDNTANTNIVELGGRTYAIIEAGGLPVELTDELETVACSSLSGTLPHGFSAHPKTDPLTGEHHVMTYQPGLEAIRYLRVGADGKVAAASAISAPHCPMIHDVAFTRNWVVVLDLPVTFNLSAFATGLPFAWDETRTPRLGLLPKSGEVGGLRWFETPVCYVFHFMNAFETGGRVVIDLVRHPKMFDSYRLGPREGRPVLVRWEIDLASGRLTETLLSDRGQEFPRFNETRAGLSYRFGYASTIGEDREPLGPLLKHDLERGTCEVHDFGEGRIAQEPVFVPRPSAGSEDDGWILTYLHDGSSNRAEVVILNADDFTGPPAARIRIPARVPFGFHGNWLPDRA